MKLTITYRCGHSEQTTLYGGNYQQQASRKAQQLCPACYRGQQIETAQAATSELPALTGSEKQIRWATQIRATMMSRLHEAAEKLPEDQQELMSRVVAAVERQTSAAWWIDRRDKPASHIAGEVAKAEGIVA